MDITKLIHIRDDGSVKLGNRVACDGGLLESEDFHIVTHAHKDHYKPQSVKETWRKHHKKVYLSDLTMQLADIYELSLIDNHGKREILEFNEPLIDENIEIKIIENGHILGSSQVQVIEEGVGRFGYSGDFCSQIEEFIDVDYLVLDSTYSGKTSNRTWTEKKCVEELVERVKSARQKGPVTILAVPGMLQETLYHIGELGYWDEVEYIIGDKITRHWSKVYDSQGLDQPKKVIIRDTEEGQFAMKDPKRIIVSHNRNPRSLPKGTVFKISHFSPNNDKPIRSHSDNENLFTVGLTSHATGDDVLSYVENVNPELVITDSVRKERTANELKDKIYEKLNIRAIASNEIKRENIN